MYRLILGTDLGADLPFETLLSLIRKAGWDGVFTEWRENGGIRQYADAIRRQGLVYQSVHAPFGQVDRLWDPGEAGEQEVARQIACLEDCAANGVHLVIQHAIIGMEKCTPTPLGVARFGRIFDAAERCGVTVALENTEGECYLETLLRAYADRACVRFCIDTGHEMCYNYSQDLITKYGSQLICTHCNDNLKITGETITGLDDAHMLPFDGLADWPDIAARLRRVGYQGDVTLEIWMQNAPGRHTHEIYADLDAEGFIALALERAKQFRRLLQWDAAGA